ncbi:MAG: acyloxyacyl hydrolase [Bacteroidales bacterium]
MKKNILLFSIIFLLHNVCNYAIAQEENTVFYQPVIQLEYMTGKVDNPVPVENLNNSQYGKISVLNTTGLQENSYFKNYKDPYVGISFLAGYLGKKDVFGSVIGVYPQWNYHFLDNNAISWDINLGTGFAFFSTPYDKITNPENELIGSYVSNITDVSTNLVFRFNKKFHIKTGVGLIHVSNGHTKIPNVGLDDFTVRLGMMYKPGKLVGLEMPKPKVFSQDTLWRKNLSIHIGRHKLAYSRYPVDGPSYTIYGFSGYISRQLSLINEIQFGLKYLYYRSYHTLIDIDEMYDYFKFFRSSVISLQVGHEFLLNHVGFVTDVGIKIYDPIYRDFFLKHDNTTSGWFKQYLTGKMGFEIYPYKNAFSGKKLSIGMFLKTNLFQADFVEYNMTYTF